MSKKAFQSRLWIEDLFKVLYRQKTSSKTSMDGKPYLKTFMDRSLIYGIPEIKDLHNFFPSRNTSLKVLYRLKNCPKFGLRFWSLFSDSRSSKDLLRPEDLHQVFFDRRSLPGKIHLKYPQWTEYLLQVFYGPKPFSRYSMDRRLPQVFYGPKTFSRFSMDRT